MGTGKGAFFNNPSSTGFGSISHAANESLTHVGNGKGDGIEFDASLSSAIYGKSTTLQAPSLRAFYIIKT